MKWNYSEEIINSTHKRVCYLRDKKATARHPYTWIFVSKIVPINKVVKL